MRGKTILKRAAGFLLAAAMLPLTAPTLRAEEASPSRRLADYSGEGTLIAVIDAGFDPTHAVFSEMPEAGRLTKQLVTAILGREYAAAYISDKIPLALDYAGGVFLPDLQEAGGLDTGLYNLSDSGTAAASLAAGKYTGKGDVETEDGILHDADFRGGAPEAQLLLMKAAEDGTRLLRADAVTAAITDALALGADAICLDLSQTEMTDAVASALSDAARAGVPVISAAGDLSEATLHLLKSLPAAITDRGTLPVGASLPGVITVGSFADPTAGTVSFLLGEREIFYSDTSKEYIGKSFAEIFAGRSLPVVTVPGVGTAEDFSAVADSVSGKLALVARGEISFVEKAQNAAAAGAVGMIVVDSGDEGISRMALTGSTIPAVMITAEDGALFAEAEAAEGEITLAEALSARAKFSAYGATEDFSATVSVLAAGDNVRVATADGYDYSSSTAHAAARVAGYYAATLSYARAAGIDDADAKALLFAAATPMTDADGMPLSPREVGAGMLTEEALFPETLVCGADSGAVSMLGAWANNSVWFTLELVNNAPVARAYTLSVAFMTDGTDERGILTGGGVPLSGVHMSITCDGRSLTGENAVCTVGASSRATVHVRFVLDAEAKEQLSLNAPHGAFADAVLTCTAGEETVCHGISFFRRGRSDQPLSDATVYSGEQALLSDTSLSVYSASGGYAYPLGTLTPGAPSEEYDMAYTIINPVQLRDGSLELRLTALRRIGASQARFYDSDDRLVHTCALGEVERYLVTGGRTVLPLWDFRAADEPAYIFPAGEYRCEITLTAADGRDTETVSFLVRTDSAAPTLSAVSFADDGAGALSVSLTAADTVALSSVKVYDLARDYGIASDGVLGKTEATLSFDISRYDGVSPLYIEATDLAGGVTTYRYTLTEIAEMLAGTAA